MSTEQSAEQSAPQSGSPTGSRPRPRSTPRPAPKPAPAPRPRPGPSPKPAPTTPATEPTPAGRSAAGRSRRPKLLVLALIFVLAAADIALYLTRDAGTSGHDQTAQSTGSAARAAATKLVPQVLTYSYRSIDDDISRASNDLTGPFRSSFTALLQSKVKPAVVSRKLTTAAQQGGVGVVSASTDHVDLVVFVTVSTTGGGVTQTVSSARLVTMRRSGDTWLISAMRTA